MILARIITTKRHLKKLDACLYDHDYNTEEYVRAQFQFRELLIRAAKEIGCELNIKFCSTKDEVVTLARNRSFDIITAIDIDEFYKYFSFLMIESPLLLSNSGKYYLSTNNNDLILTKAGISSCTLVNVANTLIMPMQKTIDKKTVCIVFNDDFNLFNSAIVLFHQLQESSRANTEVRYCIIKSEVDKDSTLAFLRMLSKNSKCTVFLHKDFQELQKYMDDDCYSIDFRTDYGKNPSALEESHSRKLTGPK